MLYDGIQWTFSTIIFSYENVEKFIKIKHLLFDASFSPNYTTVYCTELHNGEQFMMQPYRVSDLTITSNYHH